ncbi:MAG: HD domain-containing protein [Euryarchaeota archaeon]|nr:HD domain-containing protein [Euryarchaeota archaeon]
MKNADNDEEIEKAITFLVFAIHKAGHNPKPVILHSIRVGIHLYNLAYRKDIVIAGILHDVIEDSKTSLEEVRSQFGETVSNLVAANSFDEAIDDTVERYKETFDRCRSAGRDALIVKAADIFDNADYCCADSNNAWWIEKMRYFIEISQDILNDELIYKELTAKYDGIVKPRNLAKSIMGE